MNTRSLQKDQNDKRYFPRWETSSQVMLQLTSTPKTYQATTKDINCSGACLFSPEELPLNSEVQVTVKLTPQKKAMFKGKVVWNKKAGSEYQAGVNFYNVNDADANALLDFAYEFKREDLVKHWFKGWD